MLQRAEPTWCRTPMEAPSPDAAAPCEGKPGHETLGSCQGLVAAQRGARAGPGVWGTRRASRADRGPWGCTSPVTCLVGCPRQTRHGRRENDAHRGTRLRAEYGLAPAAPAPRRVRTEHCLARDGLASAIRSSGTGVARQHACEASRVCSSHVCHGVGTRYRAQPATACGGPTMCWVQHPPWQLCYDAVTSVHTGRVPGREEMRWTVSRSWIRCWPSCASGAGWTACTVLATSSPLTGMVE